ncbi:hypothetical protein ROTAS13_03196 [Roseomonas sp. TAS13]|uniref:hypothetical protein n=1 Tax=Roseomonas TaxID=125216 RepID=UPI000963F20D|nr:MULTISPECIES: hypothetical protein [Roseomonas]MCG7351423.1 hypothetical protein [Roseomonas mucosa]MCG7358082.1 hypothetical protein [Roseomonas mucosa]GAV35519.1 hypothetical protein ROTAS13_03196 [Roseomonas sp. TAS13]
MLAFASSLAAFHLLVSPLQPVDFQLMPNTQAQLPALGVLSASVGSPADLAPAEPEEAPARPRYSIAHGFGNGVPLSFAAKQIVPYPFRVVYRKGVDQETLVSWKGGKPWNQILGATLTQHGLRMVLIGRTLTIG